MFCHYCGNKLSPLEERGVRKATLRMPPVCTIARCQSCNDAKAGDAHREVDTRLSFRDWLTSGGAAPLQEAL